MSIPEAPLVVWLLVIVQLAGLASTWLVRFSEGSRGQASCQRLFFGCLWLVGLGTMASLCLGPGCWMTSGATLSLMVVAVTCDFRRSRRAVVW